MLDDLSATLKALTEALDANNEEAAGRAAIALVGGVVRDIHEIAEALTTIASAQHNAMYNLGEIVCAIRNK